ncbi:cytochrome P450 [Pseudomonas sp. SID14000]|uniref:cytochrome P450 n=1 Tax=Pseudomonas sp. SID14000 TaxID=1986221 RepID=UPI001C43FA55|nr:cytochrome P450 [Pseudomonas sp. SID14000]
MSDLKDFRGSDFSGATEAERSVSSSFDLVPGSDDTSPEFNDPSYMLKDPLGLTTQALEKYGNIVYLRGINGYLVADAPFIESMLIGDERFFSKSAETMEKISPAIGNGLSTLIGDEWKRQRKIANPSFSKRSVDAFGPVFHECIDEMFDEWDARSEGMLDATQEMKKLTLRIVIKCLFSTDIQRFTSDVTAALEVLQEYSLLKLWSPASISAADEKAYENAKEKIDTIIYRIIQDRRQNKGIQHNDLLSMYMSAVYEDTGEGMTDIQLRHEVMNLFLAGHETTANGVAFALYLLAKNADEQKKLHAEVEAELGDAICTLEDLKRLDYTDWVFKESLRLYPSSWGMSRVAVADYQYKNYLFPKGADFIVAQWGLHRNPEYWQEPLKFDPERFAPERIKQVHKYAYLPFGAGARKCIGVHLAEAEGKTILVRIAQRYALRTVNGNEPTLKARLFMTSEPGVCLEFIKYD